MPSVEVSTPSVYSEPPPWVPLSVVENLNGCSVGWLKL